MYIWVVNPFELLPNESDVPLRYWSLCRTLAQLGHKVIWWSSDFSHRPKIKRQPCTDVDDFSIRMIETPPYSKNISLARLKNHKVFADGFYRDAMIGLKQGELQAPNRIIVSLPPLGIAEKAFAIRDSINTVTSTVPRSPSTQSLNFSTSSKCKVVVDVMDAWPDNFYQVLPQSLRRFVGPILLSGMHRSASRAYLGADKISAVGQSYLDLARQYLNGTSENGKTDTGKIRDQPTKSSKPMLLCFHGTDLERFVKTPERAHAKTLTTQPLNVVYLGTMGSNYDLMTIIRVAARWQAEGTFPFQLHFAGTGQQLEKLKTECGKYNLLSPQPPDASLPPPAKVVFHGYLRKEGISKLLLSADLALVPNKPDSLVACPYKAGEYAAAGLPMISCLEGELGQLLKQWDAGNSYKHGDVDSLYATLKKYESDNRLIKQQSQNALNMAQALFDRTKSYKKFAAFVCS